MLEISAADPERQIIAFVKDWMKLLSADSLQKACELLEHPNNYEIVWTPDLIRKTVHEIFGPDTIFYNLHPEGPVFTDPYELPEQKFVEVVEYADKSGYYFEYDLPLNGEWSDLTAQFEFIRNDGNYSVFLIDLHVL